MSTKKQISRLCKLYSVYEEKPEDFSDETDVDSYFHHNILETSQSHHRTVRVSKESNKKSFAIEVFYFCDSNLQQQPILKEDVSVSKKENESLLDSLGEFFKAFDKANKVSQIPLPKYKFEIEFTKTKDELFSHCYKNIVERMNRQFRLLYQFWKKTRLAFFQSKILDITVFNSFLQKLSTLVTAESNISTRIDFLLPTSVTFLRAITMGCVAHSPLIVGMTIALLFSLGTCFVRKQRIRVNFAWTKRLFNFSAEAIINVRNARLCSKCAIFLLKIKQIPFSCCLAERFTFLKRVQSQFKMLLEMSIAPVSIVSTERNANLLAVM